MTTGWHTITSVSLQASSLSLIFKAHTNLLSCIVSISTNDLDGHFTNGTFLQPLRDHDYMFTLLQHYMVCMSQNQQGKFEVVHVLT